MDSGLERRHNTYGVTLINPRPEMPRAVAMTVSSSAALISLAVNIPSDVIVPPLPATDHLGTMLTIRPFASRPIARICRDLAASVAVGVMTIVVNESVSEIVWTEQADATIAATAIAALILVRTRGRRSYWTIRFIVMRFIRSSSNDGGERECDDQLKSSSSARHEPAAIAPQC